MKYPVKRERGEKGTGAKLLNFYKGMVDPKFWTGVRREIREETRDGVDFLSCSVSPKTRHPRRDAMVQSVNGVCPSPGWPFCDSSSPRQVLNDSRGPRSPPGYVGFFGFDLQPKRPVPGSGRCEEDRNQASLGFFEVEQQKWQALPAFF